MKQAAKSVVVALAVAWGVVALAQTKPNFSGTWADANGNELHIRHDATSITIGHPEGGHGPQHSQRFSLDGKQAKHANLAHPTETDIIQATWDGQRLVLLTRMENGVEHMQALSLQPDGALLIEVTVSGPDRRAETTRGTLKKK
jgi:hypothetical protein